LVYNEYVKILFETKQMFIVFDIGGTNSRFASSKDGTTLLETITKPTPQNLDEAVLLYEEIITKLSSEEKIDGIAGGVPGMLTTDKAQLSAAPHLRSWVNKPIREYLQRISKCQNVYLENDAAMASLGEASFGAGKDYRIVAYMGIGTGIGGARVVDGVIDARSQGFEPGHMVIAPGKDLETVISGTTIMQKYHKKAAELDDVFWHEFEEYLIMGLQNITVMWSPDIIVLGGGVILESGLSQDRIMLHLYKTLTIYPRLPKIIKASLGDHAGLMGALTYLKQNSTPNTK
jgi:glucokinase